MDFRQRTMPLLKNNSFFRSLFSFFFPASNMYCLITNDIVMNFDTIDELTAFVYNSDQTKKKAKQKSSRKKPAETPTYTIVPIDHAQVTVTFD